MVFAGPNAALGAPCVRAACPYELLERLGTAGLEAPPPLRVLLVSGVADVDVPATMTLTLPKAGLCALEAATHAGEYV